MFVKTIDSFELQSYSTNSGPTAVADCGMVSTLDDAVSDDEQNICRNNSVVFSSLEDDESSVQVVNTSELNENVLPNIMPLGSCIDRHFLYPKLTQMSLSTPFR